MVGEIVPGNEFYDYADKYLQDTAELIAPAELPEHVAERLRELAVDAFAAIGGAGLARVDFLLEGEDGSRQRDQHPARLHQHLDVPAPLGALRSAAAASWSTAWSTSPSSATATAMRLDEGIKEFLAELGSA